MEILQGGQALDFALAELGRKAAGQISRQSLRIGAKIIQSQAVANAPVRTGLTRRSIKVRAGARKSGRVSVNVTLNKGAYRGDDFYGAFQELGWHPGSRKLANRKWIEGKHFMENAFKAKAGAALAAVMDGLRERIEAAAAGAPRT